MKSDAKLHLIKLAHTVIWLLFVLCILAIPIFGYLGRFQQALGLSGAVLIEVAVLAFNHGECPLTRMAGRYSQDRSANFDIYLPMWLARYNKPVFGTLFALGSIFTLYRGLA